FLRPGAAAPAPGAGAGAGTEGPQGVRGAERAAEEAARRMAEAGRRGGRRAAGEEAAPGPPRPVGGPRGRPVRPRTPAGLGGERGRCPGGVCWIETEADSPRGAFTAASEAGCRPSVLGPAPPGPLGGERAGLPPRTALPVAPRGTAP